MRKNCDDNYTTCKEAYIEISKYVPENTSICDPFYNDGKAEKYMKEAFPTCIIMHRDEDAFTMDIDADLIVTNPPFSKKFEVLKWLTEKKKPFMVLLPISCVPCKFFKQIPGFNEFQYIIPDGRISFENSEGKILSPWFPCCWICHKMNLPRQINFASNS